MRIEDKIESDVNNLDILVPELCGRPGQPQCPNIVERSLAGQFLENPRRVPWGVPGSLGEHMQGNRLVDMAFDTVLHPLNRIYSVPAFRGITSIQSIAVPDYGYLDLYC